VSGDIEGISSSTTNNESASMGSNISDSIITASSEISNSVVGLESTLESLLSSSTFTALLQMSLVAVIGALSAYIFNALHWKMVERNKKVSSVAIELRAIINDLESISVDYWTKDYIEENRQDIHIAEISIKSKVRLISRYIKLIIAELNIKKADQNAHKLEEFSLNIFDLVTGDEFESRDRKSSKPKAQKILNECSDIRVTILSIDLCK